MANTTISPKRWRRSEVSLIAASSFRKPNRPLDAHPAEPAGRRPLPLAAAGRRPTA